MIFLNNPDEIQLHKSAVALGKFDGMHQGHQTLLKKIVDNSMELQSVMFTFDPQIHALSGKKKMIYTSEERKYILEKQNLDVLVEYPFTKEFAALSPELFVKQILVEKLDAKYVVVGEDFHFGYKREGDAGLLSKLGKKYGFDVEIMPKLKSHNEKVSSSEIIKLLDRGKVKEANQLLGHPFFIKGEVIYGQQLGRTIDIPTANLAMDPLKLVPKHGVYGVKVICKEKTYKGICNIGVKPTVKGVHAPGAETYIFQFADNIYGEELVVELLEFIRPEKKFASLEELVEQMQKDILFAKSLAI